MTDHLRLLVIIIIIIIIHDKLNLPFFSGNAFHLEAIRRRHCPGVSSSPFPDPGRDQNYGPPRAKGWPRAPSPKPNHSRKGRATRREQSPVSPGAQTLRTSHSPHVAVCTLEQQHFQSTRVWTEMVLDLHLGIYGYRRSEKPRHLHPNGSQQKCPQ